MKPTCFQKPKFPVFFSAFIRSMDILENVLHHKWSCAYRGIGRSRKSSDIDNKNSKSRFVHFFEFGTFGDV